MRAIRDAEGLTPLFALRILGPEQQVGESRAEDCARAAGIPEAILQRMHFFKKAFDQGTPAELLTLQSIPAEKIRQAEETCKSLLLLLNKN